MMGHEPVGHAYKAYNLANEGVWTHRERRLIAITGRELPIGEFIQGLQECKTNDGKASQIYGLVSAPSWKLPSCNHFTLWRTLGLCHA